MDTGQFGNSGSTKPPQFGSTSFPEGGMKPKDDKPISIADEPVPMAEPDGPAGLSKKITAFERAAKHADSWQRKPNTTGQGAIHCRTFHTKLTDEALKYMDQTINEWLDAHPEYEVKFVNSSVGTLTGKLKEPHLICQVWV